MVTTPLVHWVGGWVDHSCRGGLGGWVGGWVYLPRFHYFQHVNQPGGVRHGHHSAKEPNVEFVDRLIKQPSFFPEGTDEVFCIEKVGGGEDRGEQGG